MKHVPVFAACAAAATILMAGCGGGSNDPAGKVTGDPAAVAEFCAGLSPPNDAAGTYAAIKTFPDLTAAMESAQGLPAGSIGRILEDVIANGGCPK